MSWTETKILNPSRSDFKYPSDFGFLKNCRIPSDSDADSESVTSLEWKRFRTNDSSCISISTGSALTVTTFDRIYTVLAGRKTLLNPTQSIDSYSLLIYSIYICVFWFVYVYFWCICTRLWLYSVYCDVDLHQFIFVWEDTITKSYRPINLKLWFFCCRTNSLEFSER